MARNPNEFCGPGGIRVTRVSGSDYMARATMPDVYPREEDPFRPPPALDPGCSVLPGGGLPPGVQILQCLTMPAQRPNVIQRATNFQVTVPVAPNSIAFTNSRFECDSMLLDLPSTAANSAFWGYGSTVTAANGIEIQAGQPILIEPENTREMWEIQRTLEFIAALLARDRGVPCLPPFRAPRVVFNANEWFLTTTVAVTMSIMLFHVPELQ
jgi:hypothetical protein